MKSFQCFTCKKEFKSKKSDKNRIPKYCCRGCYAKREITEEWIKKLSDVKKGRPAWNKGMKIWEGKEHPRGTLGKPSKRKGTKVSEETRKKCRESHLGKPCNSIRGENSHFWKGGVTSENMAIRKCLEYKNWRREVFERDEYTCQECNVRGGNLNADHILPFSTHKELRFNVDNGRTLCLTCHLKTDTFGGRMHKKTLATAIS